MIHKQPCIRLTVVVALVVAGLPVFADASDSSRQNRNREPYRIDSPLVNGLVEIDQRGYFVFHRSRQFVEFMDDADGFLAKVSGPADFTCVLPMKFGNLSIRQEMKGRITVVSGSKGERLMLHYTHNETIGGPARFEPKMLNASVRGASGILSLSISIPRTKRALWRLVWQDAVASYELNLDDMLTENNDPLLSREEVLEMAEQISCKGVK